MIRSWKNLARLNASKFTTAALVWDALLSIKFQAVDKSTSTKKVVYQWRFSQGSNCHSVDESEFSSALSVYQFLFFKVS